MRENKKNAIVIAIILILSCFVTGFSGKNSTVFLDNFSNSKVLNMGITRGNCLNCGWFTHITCMRDHVYDGNTTHSYSGGTCRINWYTASGQDRCLKCGHVNEYFNRHHCIENHLDCGKGQVNICPLPYAPTV